MSVLPASKSIAPALEQNEFAGRANPLPTQEKTARNERAEPLSAHFARLGFTTAVLFLLSFGWMFSLREEFTPEEGTGYWLGIAGGTLLLFVLAYPLRKRARFMARLGTPPSWFRFHMILGIVGPILILYHSNFSLGATNSNVALFAMLGVSASGITGRYFYGKIHNGLYGAHSNLQDILREATSLLTVIESEVGGAGGSISGTLTEFAAKALKPRVSLLANFGTTIWLTFVVLFIRPRIMSAVRTAINTNAFPQHWSGKEKRYHYRAAKLHVTSYFAAVVKAAELSFYERLFALWHVLHVPLYCLLILTGITHVISVHLY